MARLFTCGFEENNFLETMWTAVTGTPTIQTTTVRSGTYALEFAADTTDVIRRNFSSAKSTGTVWTRFYVRLPSLPSAERGLADFRSLNAGNTAWWVTVQSTGRLDLTNVITIQTIQGPVLNTNQWYRIEVRHLLSDTAGLQCETARTRSEAISADQAHLRQLHATGSIPKGRAGKSAGCAEVMP